MTGPTKRRVVVVNNRFRVTKNDALVEKVKRMKLEQWAEEVRVDGND